MSVHLTTGYARCRIPDSAHCHHGRHHRMSGLFKTYTAILVSNLKPVVGVFSQVYHRYHSVTCNGLAARRVDVAWPHPRDLDFTIVPDSEGMVAGQNPYPNWAAGFNATRWNTINVS